MIGTASPSQRRRSGNPDPNSIPKSWGVETGAVLGALFAPQLGDIALAWETCAAEAEEAGKPIADHVTHLIVHGFLHLLGYDHIREGDARLMETLEVRILASLGLSDPYE